MGAEVQDIHSMSLKYEASRRLKHKFMVMSTVLLLSLTLWMQGSKIFMLKKKKGASQEKQVCGFHQSVLIVRLKS